MPAGTTGHVVAGHAHVALPVPGQVGGGERHRRPVRRRVGAEDVTAVVGHVQPLVTVGRPRVGPGQAITRLRVAGDAAAHRPMAPSTCTHAPIVGSRHSRDQVVAGAGVDVAGLQADDGGSGRRSRREPGRALRLDAPVRRRRRRRDDRAGAQPSKRSAPVDGGVPVRRGDHANGRRAEQPVALDVPAGVGEDAVAGHRQRRRVGRLGAGHEAGGGPAGSRSRS